MGHLIENSKVALTKHLHIFRIKEENQELSDKLINNLIKNKHDFTDPSNNFVFSAPNISYLDLTTGKSKALWLYIDQI